MRQRFLIESVLNLRQNLEKVGSKLLISNQKPEDVIPHLIDKDCDNTIVYQQEVCSEELAVEKKLSKCCVGVKLEQLWGSTVYHIDDLGFDIDRLPHVYTKFREACLN